MEPTADTHENSVERHYVRNTFAFTMYDVVGGMGGAFIMSAVIVAYLDALGSPKMLMGFVLTMGSIFSLGQLVVNYLVTPARRLVIFRSVYAVGALPWLAYALVSALWGETWSQSAHFALLIFAMLAMQACHSSMTGLHMEVITDNTPVQRRGQSFAFRVCGGGIGGVIGGFGVYQVLGAWETPLNFRIGFAIGMAVYLGACAMFWIVRDHINPDHAKHYPTQRGPFWAHVRDIWKTMLAEANYRAFLLIVTFFSIAASGGAFMVAAAREQLGATPQIQGLFGTIQIGTMAALGWFTGRLADRFGYQLIGISCGVMLAAAYLLLLLTRGIVYWYLASGAFAFCGMCLAMLVWNMSAELLPNLPPRHLMALRSAINVICIMPATTFAGFLVDRTHSYQIIFIAYAILGLAGAAAFAVFVRDPRAATAAVPSLARKPKADVAEGEL